MVGKLSYTQARSIYATLSSKNGMKGMNQTLKMAGSRVSAGSIKTMVKHRMDKLRKGK